MAIKKIKQINEYDACVGCGVCTTYCNFAAIWTSSIDENHIVVDPQTCHGCTDCVIDEYCPSTLTTIEIEVDTNKAVTYDMFYKMMGNYDAIGTSSKTLYKAYKHEDYLKRTFMATPMQRYLSVSNTTAGHVPTFDDFITTYSAHSTPSAYTVTFESYTDGFTFFDPLTTNSVSTLSVNDSTITSGKSTFDDLTPIEVDKPIKNKTDLTSATTFSYWNQGEDLWIQLKGGNNTATISKNQIIEYQANCSGYKTVTGTTGPITADTTVSIRMEASGGTTGSTSGGTTGSTSGGTTGSTTTFNPTITFSVNGYGKEGMNLGNLQFIITDSTGYNRKYTSSVFLGGSGSRPTYIIGDTNTVGTATGISNSDKLWVLMGNDNNSNTTVSETFNGGASYQYDNGLMENPPVIGGDPSGLQHTATESKWWHWYIVNDSNMLMKSSNSSHSIHVTISDYL